MGLGVTGRAVAVALHARELPVRLVDDRPGSPAQAIADHLGVDLLAAPTGDQWPAIVEGCTRIVMSPGVPDGHPIFDAARRAGVPIVDEFDLADEWDQRPRCAVTGTNGKTTVVTLVAEMLHRSGIRTMAAGNTDIPLVAAIDDPDIQTFVVEASSFRLAHAGRVTAQVGAWLNFAPDHLDVHADLGAYEAAKRRIWDGVATPADAVANLGDPTVAGHAPAGATGFGTAAATCRIEGDGLWYDGDRVVAVADLRRTLPHDLDNAQAAIAVALRSGATVDGCAAALAEFDGLPHRMQLVADIDGVRFVDDSKATTPHATVSAVTAVPGAVLIAGGRNKGLDLTAMSAASPRAVVAIGEAAGEITEAFAGRCPVTTADSMAAAVDLAAALASPDGTVLLSPGCSSFDWYDSYADRGRDFARHVGERTTAVIR